MSTQSPESGLGFLVHDVSRLLRKRFDRRAQSLGLTRAQWQAIVHLQRNEGITQTALAEILEVEKITLARLIDRLEAAGWVERRPHPSDRRANCLYLTAKVGPAVERMQRLAQETRAEALVGLSGEEQARLLEALLVIKRNLLALEARNGVDGTAAPPASGIKNSKVNP